MEGPTEGVGPHRVNGGQSGSGSSPGGSRSDGSRRRRWALVALAVLLLAGIAAFGYVLWQRGGSGNSVAGVPGLRPGVPRIVSLSQLKSFAAEEGPIYWAGPRAGSEYEVTVTTDGSTFVRYLPHGVAAGSRRDFLTVGTYSAIDGYNALVTAKMRDADVNVGRSGAVIATFHSAPDSTYFSFPRASFEVEVFSPVAGQSRRMTESGQIRLVPDH